MCWCMKHFESIYHSLNESKNITEDRTSVSESLGLSSLLNLFLLVTVKYDQY